MATYLLLGTYLVSLSTLCVCSTGRLRLSCVWMAAFASKIEHISPAQPAGSSQHQRGGSSKCFTPLVFKMSSKQQTLPLSRLSAETFYFKGKWWLGDHPWFFFFFFSIWQVFSLSPTREYCWDEVRKPIMTQKTNEPQLSMELFKTTRLNLRPHKWKPEKVHGWSDPVPRAHAC